MIVILSDNNYIEQALSNFQVYKNLGICTIADYSKLSNKNVLLVIDKNVDINKQVELSITISNEKKVADLHKPFHISSLNLLINKKLKILSSYTAPQKFSFYFNRRLIIDLKNKLLSSLTEKESKLLRYLLRTPGKFINKKKILREIWKYGDDLETSTLETHLYHLRTKFKKLGYFDIIEIKKDAVKVNL